jgi:hypothetical protein
MAAHALRKGGMRRVEIIAAVPEGHHFGKKPAGYTVYTLAGRPGPGLAGRQPRRRDCHPLPGALKPRRVKFECTACLPGLKAALLGVTFHPVGTFAPRKDGLS